MAAVARPARLVSQRNHCAVTVPFAGKREPRSIQLLYRSARRERPPSRRARWFAMLTVDLMAIGTADGATSEKVGDAPMRHAMATGSGDPVGFRFDDRSMPRNLSATGCPRRRCELLLNLNRAAHAHHRTPTS
jgi:hypothetical protein